MAGLVTNDSLDAMRAIVERGAAILGGPRQERAPYSSLEEQLAERMKDRVRRLPALRRPGPAEYRAAKRRVRQRLEEQPASGARPFWEGRWTPVHRFGVLGKALPPEERAAQQARQLLARHAIVTRQSLEREEGAWDWVPIYRHLQRMEMRGEVRRGYFVTGLPGVQFALPDVVERLRALGNSPSASPSQGMQSLSAYQAVGGDGEALVVMNACDPANLYGPALDYPETRPDETGLEAATGESLRFARIPSTWFVQQRGLPVLVAEDTGARITTLPGVSDGLIRRALHALLDHLGSFQRRVTIQTWNSAPVLDGSGRPLLESVGFYRDYPGMTWERP
jgi:ATP-dependent Lhr-like helicase